MRLLALDTATEACSAALYTGDAVVARFEEVGRGHAEQILGMIDAVLAEGGVTLSMLDGIAASVGPGAFTGVRISVSVAQGLAVGAGLPVVAVTTLEALAWAALHAGASRVLACLDARMGEVYWGCFERDGRGGLGVALESGVATPEAVRVPFSQRFHGIGRGFAAYPGLAALAGIVLAPGADRALPDARDMALLGARRLAAGGGIDPADLTPQYLRDKVALTERERAARQS